MSLNIHEVPFGRPALLLLRDQIAAAQHENPLAPVTVVVPRNITGLAIRRILASGDLGPMEADGRNGVLNVRFTTLVRLAEELAGPVLAALGEKPASEAILRAAARHALDESSSELFRPVRDHPSTVRAVVATYRDLSGISWQSRSNVSAASTRAAAVVDLVEHMETELSGWTDEGRRIDVAVEALAGGMSSTEPILVHLPPRLTLHHERFLLALSEYRPVSVNVGMTGDAQANQGAIRMVERLQADTGSVDSPPVVAIETIPRGTAVLSVSTADAEIRIVVRQALERARAGSRFERMAIVHGGSDVYERLIRETLESAGIPYHWVGGPPLADSVAGRALLGLLDLSERGWHRNELMAWLASAPILAGREVAPTTTWDLLSRRAGVTSGIGNWHHQLGAFVEHCQTTLADGDQSDHGTPSSGRVRRLRSDIAQAQDLGRFVDSLAARFTQLPSTWTAWTNWVLQILDDYLGSPTHRDVWSLNDEEALAALRTAIQALSVLDEFGGAPDRTLIRQVLSSELERSSPQTSKFGHGILVGPFSLLQGLDFDTIFVVGMVDGAFPGRATDDALVPDHERRMSGDDIPLRSARSNDAARDYLAALSSAPERLLSFARGDQRQGREQRPARWLLDTLGSLAGSERRLFSGDIADLGSLPEFAVIPSFLAAVRMSGEPMSKWDWDLRSALQWTEAGHRLLDHPVVGTQPSLVRSLVASQERRSGTFSRFDGRVGFKPVAERGAFSATSLQTYAECPRRYLMERVLRVAVQDRPEEIMTIDASTRGTMIHAILEQFIAVQLALPREQRIRPEEAWSAEDHHLLGTIAQATFTEFEEQGITGLPVLWEREKVGLLRDLHRFLGEDDVFRSSRGLVPERVELAFGPGHGEPVTLTLPDGRTIEFKGSVDRVDRTGDGSLAVIDYKTGRDFGFKGFDEDPLVRGTKMQLPIYGLAARRRFGDSPTYASYWFISDKGNFEQKGYDLTATEEQHFSEVVEVLADGIDGGLFPARPGNNEVNCTYCHFEQMCPGDKERSWMRIRPNSELADYLGLVESTDEDETAVPT